MLGDFHHIGYATRAFEDRVIFLESIGYKVEGPPFEDPSLGVIGCFLTGAGPRIELLSNLGDSKVLNPWLEQGDRMYHFGYKVSDFEHSIVALKELGAVSVVPPTRAVAFGHKKVSFLIFRNKFLYEVIES